MTTGVKNLSLYSKSGKMIAIQLFSNSRQGRLQRVYEYSLQNHLIFQSNVLITLFDL